MEAQSRKIIFRKFLSCDELEKFANRFSEGKDLFRQNIKVIWNPKNGMMFYFLMVEYLESGSG